VDKFSHVRFEPSGMTRNPDVRFAKSIVDYIFRRMATKFLSTDAQFRAGVNVREDLATTPEQLPLDVAAAAGASATAAITSPKITSFAAMQNQEDAPPLHVRLDHGALGVVLQVRELRQNGAAARRT
jgi:ribonucleoside-diphosphate reductase alpha chain